MPPHAPALDNGLAVGASAVDGLSPEAPESMDVEPALPVLTGLVCPPKKLSANKEPAVPGGRTKKVRPGASPPESSRWQILPQEMLMEQSCAAATAVASLFTEVVRNAVRLGPLPPASLGVGGTPECTPFSPKSALRIPRCATGPLRVLFP